MKHEFNNPELEKEYREQRASEAEAKHKHEFLNPELEAEYQEWKNETK